MTKAEIVAELELMSVRGRRRFGQVTVTGVSVRSPFSGAETPWFRVRYEGGKHDTPRAAEAADTIVAILGNPRLRIIGFGYDSATREGSAWLKEEA